MRVLLLAQFYPPIIGGEERHVFNLARELAVRGHDVHVATLDTGPPPVEQEGVTLHVVEHIGSRVPRLYPTADRPLALPIPDPLTTRDLSRLVKALDPDVVHAHNWMINSYVALPAAHRRPLVYSLHDYSHVCPTKRLMFEGELCSGPELRKCFSCAGAHYGAGRGQVVQGAVRLGLPIRRKAVDFFAPVSRFVGVANGLDEKGDRWQVVPNFIPDRLTTLPDLPRDEALPDAPYLLFAGDISQQKGVATLLAAYDRLDVETRPDLVLVGRPSLELPSPLPSGVHVHHHWDHDRVLSAFQHAVAAVLPSEWPDPCPTTVLEAMAVGAPLVTTQMGGIADMVIDEESALVTVPGDVAGLATALERITTDDDLRKRLATQAGVEVERYLQSRVAADFEAIYTELVAERASARASASVRPS